jgi:uncharacterized protein (TIGR00369 family)
MSAERRREGRGIGLDSSAELVNDYPDNGCFGCSPHNTEGLQMRWVRTGPGAIEGRYAVPCHYEGAPGVVHGGIQATILDETLGQAAHVDDDEGRDVVTVDFRLRYRRPCPTETPLRVRGRHVRTEGRDIFVEGEIVDEEGQVLTTAEARWRRIDARPGQAAARSSSDER